MTDEDFRKLALALPGATEGWHMGHADFRVGGKVFASLDSPREGWAMVKVTLATQAKLLELGPERVVPATGAWGRAGCTHVMLASMSTRQMKPLIEEAWRVRQDAAGKKSKQMGGRKSAAAKGGQAAPRSKAAAKKVAPKRAGKVSGKFAKKPTT